MSDEVRSSSIPTPAESGGASLESVAGPNARGGDVPAAEGADADPATLLLAPEAAAVLERGGDAELIDLPAESGEAPTQRLPRLAPELALGPVTPTYSERPPPPSQRALVSARAEQNAPTIIELAASSEGPMLPPAASLSSDLAPAPGRAPSEPVPLVVHKHSAPVSPRSSLPPGLVEPKRIIEVLGSNVPVLDKALEEEIEDLDDSEAYELSETPTPDGPESEPELELNVVVEDFSLAGDSQADGSGPAGNENERQSSVNGEHGATLHRDAMSPGARHSDAGLEAPAEGADDRDAGSDNKRAKAPPNKRRRPPPPSARVNDKPKPPEAAAVGARKWWEEMFSEEFLRAIPILSPRQLEREVNFIDESLGVARGGRMLDLACGAGQHAVELAARGYDLVGFDLSQSQLDWAGGLAQERGQRLQFTYGDMRELTYQESFDAVYSWNTSFGFFEEDKNFDVAQRVFKALRPGGRFLLDVVNRDFVVSQQPGQTWFEGDGCVCIDDVSIDFITSRMRVKRTLMLTNGRNRECNYSLRMYGLHELGKILHDVGFKILKVSGRPEMPGVFFGASSPRIIILAAKP
jgi:SAM-dependent methyltransferase